MSTTLEKIQRQIAENPILLYMKGSLYVRAAPTSPLQNEVQMEKAGLRSSQKSILYDNMTRLMSSGINGK